MPYYKTIGQYFIKIYVSFLDHFVLQTQWDIIHILYVI